MAQARNTRLVSHLDVPGGGQVWVEDNTLLVGHMSNPHGTSLFDVSDPRNPRLRATIPMPEGWHSHKVRAAGGIMIVNHERTGDASLEFGGGLGIYDIADPSKPRLLTKWKTAGKGVHRYSFDGRYAYISPTVEGYVGNIVMILDLADPTRPEEVGRWWIPGQRKAGGEDYPWTAFREPRCHHPLRLNNRLYVSYWHHGIFILDISDISRPALVSQGVKSRAFPHPTHTCLPIPGKLKGRSVMIVADEDVSKLAPSAPAFTWMYDITDEAVPIPISTFQVQGVDEDGSPASTMTGCHQPSERFRGRVIPFAWFAQGLRLIDVSDPFRMTEVGYYVPDVPEGCERVSSNDVTIDARGLIYLVDRQRGIDVIESDAM
jgi:hypothetical protein